MGIRRKQTPEETVLVGVLKSQRDYNVLFRERWYRIPAASLPKRAFRYLAFYQPTAFQKGGKRITYYARVLGARPRKRRTLLPQESKHPRVDEPYVQIRVGNIRTLAHPILNAFPRRVTFGFTTLRRLLGARNLFQLYDVAPTEQIVQRLLRRSRIPAVPQYAVADARHRYRLDFAVFCAQGPIAIECDNRKAHAGRRQRKKDAAKDAFLRRRGWTIIRLSEQEITKHAERCLLFVQRAVRKLGGLHRAGKSG